MKPKALLLGLVLAGAAGAAALAPRLLAQAPPGTTRRVALPDGGELLRLTGPDAGAPDAGPAAGDGGPVDGGPVDGGAAAAAAGGPVDGGAAAAAAGPPDAGAGLVDGGLADAGGELAGRVADLVETVEELRVRQEALEALVEAQDARIAELEDVQAEVEAEQAELAPRFDRAAVLGGTMGTLEDAVYQLAQGNGDIGSRLQTAAGELDRVAREAARIGRQVEAERATAAIDLLGVAEQALVRGDLWEARVAVQRAAALTSSTRNLARTLPGGEAETAP